MFVNEIAQLKKNMYAFQKMGALKQNYGALNFVLLIRMSFSALKFNLPFSIRVPTERYLLLPTLICTFTIFFFAIRSFLCRTVFIVKLYF